MDESPSVEAWYQLIKNYFAKINPLWQFLWQSHIWSRNLFISTIYILCAPDHRPALVGAVRRCYGHESLEPWILNKSTCSFKKGKHVLFKSLINGDNWRKQKCVKNIFKLNPSRCVNLTGTDEKAPVRAAMLFQLSPFFIFNLKTLINFSPFL